MVVVIRCNDAERHLQFSVSYDGVGDLAQIGLYHRILWVSRTDRDRDARADSLQTCRVSLTFRCPRRRRWGGAAIIIKILDGDRPEGIILA